MRPQLVVRVVRALAWRTVWRTEVLVFRAEGLVDHAAPPGEFSLIRLKGHEAEPVTAAAMRMADDEPELVGQRLADGDEFFGWQAPDGTVVSFGWARFRQRSIGPIALADRPGRVFLYNFHTLPPWRGRNLYPRLITQMRRALTESGARELIIDVNAENSSSRRGIEKAGFDFVASISYLTLFRKWRWVARADRRDPSVPELFGGPRPR